ncbi:MAG TPA: RNA polymerase subunit sigma-24, partial [Cupriavidus sp.]|nr:RNA polymerase subunit sigma-24 [Cupriavidus sp.]
MALSPEPPSSSPDTSTGLDVLLGRVALGDRLGGRA